MKAIAVILIAALVYQCNGEGPHKIGVSDLKHLLHCREKTLSPQEDFNVEQISGTWYGYEVITHHGNTGSAPAGDICLILHFEELSQEEVRKIGWPQNYQFFSLIWDDGPETEYALQYNVTNPGFFLLSEPREDNNEIEFNSFIGSVQVLTQIEDHLILTFCEEAPRSRIFTIVLTRHKIKLTVEAEVNAEKLVKYKGLKVQSIRKTCKSSITNKTNQKDENGNDDDDDSEGIASNKSLSMTMFILSVTTLLSLVLYK